MADADVATLLEAGPPFVRRARPRAWHWTLAMGLAEAPPTREEIDAQRLFADFAVLQG